MGCTAPIRTQGVVPESVPMNRASLRELQEMSQNQPFGASGISQAAILGIENDRVRLGAQRAKALALAAMILCVQKLEKVHHVRTNIEIDDKLMKDALKATGAKTKREAVELGLKTLVRLRMQEKARELKGKITWEGDLDAMRTDR